MLGNVTVYDILDVEEGDLEPTGNITLDDFFIKKKLQSEWVTANQSSIAAHSSKSASAAISEKTPFTERQRELFGVVNRYKDCLFPNRTQQNATEIRNVYCLHAVNHIFK